MKRRVAGLSLALAVTAAVTTGCVPGDPTGNLEQATGGAGTITLQGWAIDSSAATAPVEIHIYVDGNWGGSTTANVSRPDVGNAYPGYGADHGFNPTIGAAPGFRKVCAYAINVGSGKNNTNLGCKTVQVQAASPVGNFETALMDSTALTVRGWAVDPDNNAPSRVVVTFNGEVILETTADEARPDVAAAIPGAGASHGFDVDVVMPFNLLGRVCAKVINVGGGSDTNLGCFGTNRGELPILATGAYTYDPPYIQAGMNFSSTTLTGYATDTSDPGDPRAAYVISFQDREGFAWFTTPALSDSGTNAINEVVPPLPAGPTRICLIVGEPRNDRTVICSTVNL